LLSSAIEMRPTLLTSRPRAGLITPFSVYLLTTFFRTLPKELGALCSELLSIDPDARPDFVASIFSAIVCPTSGTFC